MILSDNFLHFLVLIDSVLALFWEVLSPCSSHWLTYTKIHRANSGNRLSSGHYYQQRTGLPLPASAWTSLFACLTNDCGQGLWHSHWLGLSYVSLLETGSGWYQRRPNLWPESCSERQPLKADQIIITQKIGSEWWESPNSQICCTQESTFGLTV